MPEIGHERGSRQQEQVSCLIPELMISQKWLMNLHMMPRARNNLRIRGVQNSQVSILWNYGLWAHHVLKVERAVTSYTVMIAK